MTLVCTCGRRHRNGIATATNCADFQRRTGAAGSVSRGAKALSKKSFLKQRSERGVPPTKSVSDLRPGDRFEWRDYSKDRTVVIEVLREPEDTRDRFGQPLLKVYGRIEGEGREGHMTFGPNVDVWIAE